jgi:RES domain-containing protein
MEIYRICLEKYSHALVASGNRARWNSKGNFVIYTAGTRALACLENVVHRSGEGLKELFKVVVIGVPDQLPIETLLPAQLPDNWHLPQHYFLCQPLGDRWYHRASSAVLRVPSSIIPEEFNYVLNTRHPDFSQIKLLRREDFEFDPRIKTPDPS